MSEEILKIENVSKKYRLGMIGGTTLRDELQRKKAERKGLEDPTRKVTDTSTNNIGEEFLALEDINITINQGERVGIIGHNGAGKSTLLKLISRITAPTTGTIEMNGRIASMLEVGTGFHPELTGRENIYMNGAILGMTKSEIDSKIEQIIDFSECRQFIDTPVKRYSSGMYVKLAFSVAAHLDSEIMIMDEVLAVGDMAFQKKCLDKMSQVSAEDGRTILYVSHNMNTIRQLCDRVIVLEHGKTIFDGDVDCGISRYLNECSSNALFVSLKDIGREVASTNQLLMHSIEFIDTQTMVFKRGELIKFDIKWLSNIQCNDCRFRLVIRRNDDIPVGLAQTTVLKPIKKGIITNSRFGFDSSLLAEGEYIISFGFYQKDELGNELVLDHVSRVCSFRVVPPYNDDKNIVWQKRSWGAIHFPNLKVIEE